MLELITTLRTQVERARRQKPAISEQDTKRALIDPLLSALGWDTTDLTEMRSEYRHKPSDDPVDYAMFLMRTPCLFVEAKRLGTDLANRKWVSQVIAYASTVGVTWCVLTDGNTYRLYNAHAPVDADEKLFRSVTLTEDDPGLVAATLSLLSRHNMGENRLTTLWKAHFVDRRVKEALEELITGQHNGLVNLIRKHVPGVLPMEIRQSLQRIDLNIDYPDLALESLNNATEPPAHKTKPTNQSKPVIKPESRVASGPRAPALRSGQVTLKNIIDAGLIKAPTELSVIYMGQHLTAQLLEDGTIAYNNAHYISPSTAGGYAQNSVKGLPPNGRTHWAVNGWVFWRYRDPQSGQMKPIDDLRIAFIKRHASKAQAQEQEPLVLS